MDDIDCPYGAHDCPKVKDLKKLLAENRQEVESLKTSVIQLTTTIKLTGKVVSALVSILIAILGVMQI